MCVFDCEASITGNGPKCITQYTVTVNSPWCHMLQKEIQQNSSFASF